MRDSLKIWGGVACAVALTLYGCTGDIGDPAPEGAVPAGAEAAVVSGARRLTRTEYDHTMRDLLQDNTNSGFAALPEDVNDPFDNDYKTQKVSPSLIEAAETLATQAAERAMTDTSVRDSIVPCSPSGPDDSACLASFVSSFGRKALRRPLSQEEVDEYVAQFQPFSVEGDDFYLGVKLTLTAMLQDVEFLYRVELGDEVPAKPGVFKLNNYEMATRLSYLVIGSTPPDWLLDEAAADKLSESRGVAEVAARLMDDPRARDRIDRFHALWLGFHQLAHSPELISAMRAESRALIERAVFDEGTDYFELFRSQQTYLSDFLAGHYGYDPPGGDGWVDYPDERAGILSHGTVLSSFGKFADTSPTQRGIFIRTRLLCQDIPPPPPNVDTDSPPEDPGGSDCKADQYAAHNQGGCYDCHKMMDPLGFGLERYDNQGRYRTHDDGKPECEISGDGSIDGVGDFNGPKELAELLLGTGDIERCVVTQLYRLAIGRRELTQDVPILNNLQESFSASGHGFTQLVMDLVSADSFGFRVQEEVE